MIWNPWIANCPPNATGSGEAHRRLAAAAVLGPRQALSGEPLAPVLAATAAAQAREHARNNRECADDQHLPSALSAAA